METSPSSKDPWAAIDSLCEPLVDARITLFDALQKALPVILEESLESDEAKKRLPQMVKISRLLIEHLLTTQQQLVQDKRGLLEKNEQLKAMQKELTNEILANDNWTFYKCEACQKIFVSEKFLQVHLEKRHPQDKENKGKNQDSILTHSTCAKEILKCGTVPAKGTHVRLYRNHTEAKEDLLDATVTLDDGDIVGRPQTESNIDPTLRFYHKCDVEEKNKGNYRKFAIRYNHTYVILGRVSRRTFDSGILNLKLIYPKETVVEVRGPKACQKPLASIH